MSPCICSQKEAGSLWCQESFSPLASASKLGPVVFCELPVSCQQAAITAHFLSLKCLIRDCSTISLSEKGLPSDLTIFCKRTAYPMLHVLLFCLHNHFLRRLRAMHPLGLGQPNPLGFNFLSPRPCSNDPLVN